MHPAEAAKQGVPEDELITKPEERAELPSIVEGQEPAVSEAEAAPAEELPEWMKEIEAEAVSPVIEAVPDHVHERGRQVLDDEFVESHDLLRLLSDVNDRMSSTELHSQWVVDMLLGGEEMGLLGAAAARPRHAAPCTCCTAVWRAAAPGYRAGHRRS